MNYLEYGYTVFKRHPNLFIKSEIIDDQKIWIKKASPSKKTFWHSLQNLIAKCLKAPILKATAIEQTESHISQEVERMNKLSAHGIAVPEVLAFDQTLMVMKDAGSSLNIALNNAQNNADKKELIVSAVGDLKDLHQKKLTHGKPYLRDMFLSADGKIGFLDLEEDPLSVMSLEAAQARDLFLFLCSAARFVRQTDNKLIHDEEFLRDIFDMYKKDMPPQIVQELKTLTDLINSVSSISKNSFIWSKIGSDARCAIVAARVSAG